MVGHPESLPAQLAVDFERGPISWQPRLRSSFVLMGLPLTELLQGLVVILEP